MAAYANLFSIFVQDEAVQIAFQNQLKEEEPEEVATIVLSPSNAIALRKLLTETLPTEQ